MKSIYVQSRGVSQDYDYQWKKISFDSNQEDIYYPPLVEEFQHLLDLNALSLLLVRSGDKLLLLVRDISSQGKDYRDRTIRNSVAWIGEDQDEQILRALAIRGLQSVLGQDTLFKEEINNAVEPNEK
ncbi:MAG: hypothetical protein F6K22_17070, partial [Okeania sp. SIO2F4]|nr:hypothetical protein [Okeania sp. SIO2F4]